MEVEAKLRYVGNSYVITIPKDLIKCKAIDPSKPLKIVLEQDTPMGVFPFPDRVLNSHFLNNRQGGET